MTCGTYRLSAPSYECSENRDPHHPLSPVIKLGIRHTRKPRKERKCYRDHKMKLFIVLDSPIKIWGGLFEILNEPLRGSCQWAI